MTNKERLELNNTKIEEITKTLARKQVSPTDMLQARVDGDNSCKYLFYDYSGESLDVKGLDTSNVTNMYHMFRNCSKLKSLDLSNFNTRNVTTMESMFENCSKLTSLDLSHFNTSNVTTMYYMFKDCYSITNLDLSSFDTSNVTTMNGMFKNCAKLMSLDLSSFSTSKVTSMRDMFYDCEDLKTLNISNWDTSKVTNMTQMFRHCYALETVENIDMVSVTSADSMFVLCVELKNLYLKNIKTNLQIGNGTQYGYFLTNDSLINTFKELWDLTGSTSKTLRLSTTSKENIANIYVKLVDVTEEMLAQDEYAGNKKPCVVCEPTDEGAMTLTEYAVSKNWAIA